MHDQRRRIRFSDPVARHRAQAIGVARRRRTRISASSTLLVTACFSILAGAAPPVQNPALPDACVTTPTLVVSDATVLNADGACVHSRAEAGRRRLKGN